MPNAFSTFDPMCAAGVDVAVEESGNDILARDGGSDDEAARFSSGAMEEQLRKKLSEMSRRFGLEGGADKAACCAVAVALQERMTSIIGELRPAVNLRLNAEKHTFGEGALTESTRLWCAFTEGTDTKVAWKVRAEEAKAVTRQATAESSEDDSGGTDAGASTDRGGAGASADARRLESLARQDAAAARELVAGSADVLHVLDSDHQASRSLVVQWWRITKAPLVRYVRQSARLFPPPAAQPDA